MNKKTDLIQLRISPELKQIANKKASDQHRTLSNYIETLIIKDNRKERKEMSTIRIHTSFNERNGTHRYIDFELLDELPKVGDLYKRDTVKAVYRMHKDCKQGRDEAYMAEAYELVLVNYDDDEPREFSEYVAIIPEYADEIGELFRIYPHANISIDNGNRFYTVEEALAECDWDEIVWKMDDETREEVANRMPESRTDAEFLLEYLRCAKHDIVL